MFGKNEVVGARKPESGFLLHSMFYTIQGEGPWAGMPTVFVRFAGCNLRCFWCDTDFAGGEELDTDALAQRIDAMCITHGCNNIVLTGGEPMLQPLGLLMLHHLLIGRGIQIETAGTVWPASMPEVMSDDWVIVCSPKMAYVHPKVVEHAAAWKYILRVGEVSDADGLPVMSTQSAGKPIHLFRPADLSVDGGVYVQACDEQDAAANAANLALAAKVAMDFGYRLSVQLHKLANLP